MKIYGVWSTVTFFPAPKACQGTSPVRKELPSSPYDEPPLLPMSAGSCNEVSRIYAQWPVRESSSKGVGLATPLLQLLRPLTIPRNRGDILLYTSL